MLKAIILIGSPQKGKIIFKENIPLIYIYFIFFYQGTRFRPLSLEIPKPLFPIAGFPILHHLIESCAQVSRISSLFFPIN
jgi:NDP-sugar pyrophosphorylase family protein